MRGRIALLVTAAALFPALPARALPPGSIAGVVTDGSGLPVHELCVTVSPKQLPLLPSPGTAAEVMTAEDGSFRFDDLQPGLYVVRYAECMIGVPPWGYQLHTRYYTQWYSGRDGEAEADPILVTSGTVEANAVMQRIAGLSGRVVDTAGAPVAGLCVQAARERYAWQSTDTEADGRWFIPGFEDGSYRVGFSTCGQTPAANVWRAEWWDDQATFEDALDIEFTRDADVTGIDAVVVRTGSISGTTGAGSVCVGVYDVEGTLVHEIDAFHEYVVGGLETGDYKVHFRDCHVGGYADQWYPDAATFEDAGLVHVEFGADTPDVDVALRGAGTITGRVTDSDGDPVGVCVTAWDPAGYPYVSTGTRHDGTYELPWMQPRGVKLSFNDCGDHSYEWWDDRATFEAADIVPVQAEATTTGIDAIIDGAGPPPEETARARRIPPGI